MATVKPLQYSVHYATYMFIDLRQKRFVINTQLRQCFARAQPFRLKKS